jgi:transcription antitermination factor NusG
LEGALSLQREPAVEVPAARVSNSSVCWYAAYTRANHEKSVAEQLRQRSVEHFLPCYDSVRRWKDRKVRLQMPLFPGYVFVRIPLREQMRVREIPSVSMLVGISGSPTALADDEIYALRKGFAEGVRAEPHPYLTIGRRVRVLGGPLAGFEGILVKKKNCMRFVISLELIMRSVAVEIDPAELQAL